MTFVGLHAVGSVEELAEEGYVAEVAQEEGE